MDHREYDDKTYDLMLKIMHLCEDEGLGTQEIMMMLTAMVADISCNCSNKLVAIGLLLGELSSTYESYNPPIIENNQGEKDE